MEIVIVEQSVNINNYNIRFLNKNEYQISYHTVLIVSQYRSSSVHNFTVNNDHSSPTTRLRLSRLR